MDISPGMASTVKDRYLAKIHRVMSDEYNILERFVIVSAGICPSDAEADFDRIKAAHKARNEFAHGAHASDRQLPTKDVQEIVRKLIKLHVTKQRTN